MRQVSLYVLPLILQGIGAGIGTSNFLRAFLNSFFELCIRWINKVNTAQSSGFVQVRYTFVFLLVALFLTCLSTSLATCNQAWMSFVFSSTVPQTMKTHLEAFLPIW